MSAPPTSTTQPDQATDNPTRSQRLLAIVRKLVDYGRELATTIRRRAFNDPISVRTQFGTADVATILAAISRALHRADALEARIVRAAARLDAAERGPAASRIPRTRPTAAAPPADQPESTVVRLPTPQQIAAEVRRRSIGAVLGDICRDLGIRPSHPLWGDLQFIMLEHGGNPARLAMDVLNRSLEAIVAAAPPGTTFTWPPGSLWPEVHDNPRPP